MRSEGTVVVCVCVCPLLYISPFREIMSDEEMMTDEEDIKSGVSSELEFEESDQSEE